MPFKIYQEANYWSLSRLQEISDRTQGNRSTAAQASFTAKR